MRKTLSVLAIIAALSSSAVAASSATLTGGTNDVGWYIGNGNVTISEGGSVDLYYVYGKQDGGNVSGASVVMTGGTIDAQIIGGDTTGETAAATGNTVEISGGTVTQDVRGAHANFEASDNTVTISGGQVQGHVIGGGALVGNATGNTVIISSGEVQNYVRGGYSGGGNVTGNTVTISGGEVKGEVRGGYSGEGNVTGNIITISGGEVKGEVRGGYSLDGNANGNTVTISGGTIESEVRGGHSLSRDACFNTVTISGGTIKKDIYGGNVKGTHIANNNTVNLVGEGATLGTLTGSSFTIEGSVVGSNTGSVTNNTLNVYGKGITVGGLVAQFETANFYLAPGTQNGDTMLTLTGTVNTDLTKCRTVNVKCSGATKLKGGDKVNLIHNSGSGTVSVNETTTTNVDIIKGVSATYTGTVAVSEDRKDLVLTLEGDSPVPGPTPVPDPGVKVEFNTLKSMTETRTDVAALVNATADFMTAAGMQQAKLAAKSATAAGQDGAAPFVALGGSHLRYNTGSHVNANGFNAALGVAKAVSAVTLGVAGEYGTSDYKSYVGGVRGNGDSKLFGGAVLADWQGEQGWHAEGSVRLGRARYDYNAMTPLGHTDYSDKASYQSVGIGGGKEFKVSSKSEDTVDVYARYMYGHTNGSNAKASSGESMHFAGVNSHRTMVGARYNHELTDNATLYAGAAWMHEFDGDAHSVIGGFTSPAPTLKGNSGMVELGTTFAPMDSQNVLINLNVQGWTGVQRGISGGAGCTIKF